MRGSFLDTGPTVGLLSARDEHHAATLAAITHSASQGRILCTAWEVVSEAYTLVRVRLSPPASAQPALAVLRWARESGVHILPTSDVDHQRAATLLETYSDHRLSYVDAIVLALTERHHLEEIITVDGRHFRAIRLARPAIVSVV